MPVALSLDEATGVTRKRPLTERGHLSASLDEQEIERMIRAARLHEGEELAVGGPLGPGGYIGIDCDTKQGKAGGETLKRLLERWPDLAICRYRSISGALNVIVRKPDGLGPVANVVPRDWLGVDIRADAGWVVLPGSACSWGAWRWDRGSVPLRDAWIMAPELCHLLTSATAHERPADNAETEAYINARSEYVGNARAYVLEQMAGLSRAASGSRHAALLLAVSRIIGLDAIDLRDALGRVQEVWDSITPHEGREREPHEILSWVLGQELAHAKAPPIANGDGEQYEELRLPDEVWCARPELAHVRIAAWSRNRSPEALLGAVLARLAADTKHSIEIPPIVGAPCGLTMYAALIGPPGTGKSSTRHLATELVPALLLDPAADDKGIGSGEGMIEILFDLVPAEEGKGKLIKLQTRFNAYLGLDEGEMLDRMGARPDSILLGTLRSAWTNGILGQANASIEKRRHLAGDLYAFGIVIGMQPIALKGLMGGAGLGTPQRFAFMPTTTNGTVPEELPDWPGAVPRTRLDELTLAPYRANNARGLVRHPLVIPDEIRREVVTLDRAQQRGGAAELDTHIGLLRLKVAGLLAVWQGRLEMNAEDWWIAEEYVKVSKATRDNAVREIERADKSKAQAQSVARSQAARAQARALRDDERIDRLDRIAARIKRLADEHPEGIARQEVYRATPKAHRELFEEALDRAVAEGWVYVERSPSRTGSASSTIKPKRAEQGV